MPSSSAGTAGPRSWIDAPLEGSTIPLGPYLWSAHSTDQLRIAAVEFDVNGAVWKTDANADLTDTLLSVQERWVPPTSGSYELGVRAENTAGVWGDYTSVHVTVQSTAP